MTEAVLLVSHGSVDDLDDLPLFLANVRRGHPASPALVQELRRRYEAIGGGSPLNAISAEIARKLEPVVGVRVAWANRLFMPYVRDVAMDLARRGVTHLALVPLAQHSAAVYAEDARRAVEGTGITLACAANWGQDPGLSLAFASRIATTLAGERERVTLVTTAHSLPRSVIDAGDPYEREVRAAGEAVGEGLRARLGYDVRRVVAFQSQGMGAVGPGGRPVEWLGPDLRAVIDEAAARGDRRVVFAPIGFLADHVEILYDLDLEARAMATDRGLLYSRSPSLNADGDLIDVLARLARPLLRHG